MKRDLELVRQILLQVEETEPGKILSSLEVDDGKSEQEVFEHLDLLIKAGLLEGEMLTSGIKAQGFFIHRLTWEGHEFLANAKNEKVWKKVVDQVGGKFSTLSFEVLKGLLVKAALAVYGMQ